jgi:hypothetical protein
MLNARIVLILTGLAFAIWETVDIFLIEVPAIAALFALLFLACTIWFWRRDSLRAAIAFLPLFAVEAGSAPFWKHVMTETKVAGIALGAAGIASVVALASTRLTPNRSRAGGLSSL